jgi:hypothetical protein
MGTARRITIVADARSDSFGVGHSDTGIGANSGLKASAALGGSGFLGRTDRDEGPARRLGRTRRKMGARTGRKTGRRASGE